MNEAEILSSIVRRNQEFILEATEDLNQTESVLRLPGESNCMNWVLGHVLVYRDVMLAGLGKRRVASKSDVKLYTYGSEPITSDSKSVKLPRLLILLTKSYDALEVCLEIDSDGLKERTPDEVDPRKGETVAEHLAELCWHESNHVGELHALRELALVSLGKGWK